MQKATQEEMESCPPQPWSDLPISEWQDWRWQMRNRIMDMDSLSRVLTPTQSERDAYIESTDYFRMSITPHYAALMDPTDENCPIRRQIIPSPGELENYAGMLEDPLDEENHSPVAGLVHRYPDRALIYTNHTCPVYCRHCTRKRKVGDPKSSPGRSALRDAIKYIAEHKEIHDVLLSGGEPLSLSDRNLDALLGDLNSIEHLDIIRIGTRNPVTLPQRITPELCAVLGRYRSIYINTHFNHPKECTEAAAHALNQLADAGCVLGNQMVLLKGINDNVETVYQLNRWLLRNRCRPYYMLHCDLTPGVSHFRTSTEAGLEILRGLRGRLSGLAIPQYVIDLPGGGGKIPLVPDYLVGQDEHGSYYENYQGVVHHLPHPKEDPPSSAKTTRLQ